MKWLPVIMILHVVQIQAQTFYPYSSGNLYTYTERDGIDDSNYNIFGQDNSGRVYLNSANGTIFIKGNNYTKKVKLPSGYGSHINTIHETENGIYLFGKEFWLLLKADTLFQTGKYPGNAICGNYSGAQKRVVKKRSGNSSRRCL